MDKDRETLEIYMNGRIDKDNVAETEESIDEMLRVNKHSKVEIDMSDLEAITDDGLKALKELGQKNKNVELTNVTDDIYEVFEKNGLTSVMPITKKLKLDIE